ncbi:hypothetical protein [Williamsia sp. 1135]|uniref:hypothetical protein n=1 Tax=Williamsia sp. 1135 TaxID=1889262 RepID=UPI000A1067F7|nr:hypothetical protein [Williamsia sp. 1135]ORM35544.1 hypothetical protein BFL43_09525 [Williamsia sp. 1135]
MSGTDSDVNKDWNNPRAVRAGALYLGGFVLVGIALLVAYRQTDSRFWGFCAPAVFMIGGLGAFAQTYRAWQRGGLWPLWQGVGWFLLVMMLATLGLPVRDL